jgi:hypothetical protein
MTDTEIIEAKLLNYAKRVLFLPRSILCVNLSEKMLHELKKTFPSASLQLKTDNFSALSGGSIDLFIANFSKTTLELSGLLEESLRFLDKQGLFIFSAQDRKKMLILLNKAKLLKFTLIPLAISGIKFEIYFASTFSEPIYLKKLIKFADSDDEADQLLAPVIPLEEEKTEENKHEESEEEPEEAEESEEHEESNEHEEREEREEAEEQEVEPEEHEEAEKNEEPEEHEEAEEHEEPEEHEEAEEHEEPEEHEEAEEHEEPEEHEEAEEHEEPEEHEEAEEHEEPEEPEEAEEHEEPEEHEEAEEHEEPEEHEEAEEHEEPEEHEEAEEHEEPEEHEEAEEHEEPEEHEEAEEKEKPEEHEEHKEHEQHEEIHEHEKPEVDYEKKYDSDADEHELKEPSEPHVAEKKVKQSFTATEIERVLNHPDTHPKTVERIIAAHTDVLAEHAQKLEEHTHSTAQILKEVAAGRLNQDQKVIKLQENAKQGQVLLNTYKAAVDQHQKILRKFIDTQVFSLESIDNDNYHKLIENHQKIVAEHKENIETHDNDNDDTLHL